MPRDFLRVHHSLHLPHPLHVPALRNLALDSDSFITIPICLFVCLTTITLSLYTWWFHSQASLGTCLYVGTQYAGLLCEAVLTKLSRCVFFSLCMDTHVACDNTHCWYCCMLHIYRYIETFLDEWFMHINIDSGFKPYKLESMIHVPNYDCAVYIMMGRWTILWATILHPHYMYPRFLCEAWLYRLLQLVHCLDGDPHLCSPWTVV